MQRKQLDNFIPKIIRLEQDCNLPFNAGNGFETFNSFLTDDVEDYFLNGDGVTYLIKNNDDIVAYFCITANAIPFDYLCENESEMWGISVVEIKMFAVNEKYQNTFYQYKDTNAPVSAWCLGYFIDNIQKHIGIKAIMLHSIPTAENFYLRNGFQDVNNVMKPLHDLDDNLKILWKPLQNIYFGDGLEK